MVSMEEPPAPPAIGQVSLGYSSKEDRLVLWLGRGDGAAALFLTRRLCALLINGLAGILERSSSVAAQAPAAMRDDIVLMEHQGAMAAASVRPASPDSLPPVTAAGPAPMLVETVNITTTPGAFRLVFRPSPDGAGPELALSRADLHLVLDMLKRQTELAEWNLPLAPGWLTTAAGQVTIN